MHYEALAQVLILLSLANGSPVIAKQIFGETYAAPVDGNARFFDGRPLVGPSKTIRGIVISLVVTTLGAIVLGPSILAWIIGGEHRHGGRPVLELFEAPASSVRQQQSNRARSGSGIAFSLAGLPNRVVFNRAGHRDRLPDLFCRSSPIIASVFLAAIARPPLLMCRLPPHATASAK